MKRGARVHGSRQDAGRVRTHGKERHVAQVEEARVADDDVQPQAHEDEDPHLAQDR